MLNTFRIFVGNKDRLKSEIGVDLENDSVEIKGQENEENKPNDEEYYNVNNGPKEDDTVMNGEICNDWTKSSKTIYKSASKYFNEEGAHPNAYHIQAYRETSEKKNL